MKQGKNRFTMVVALVVLSLVLLGGCTKKVTRDMTTFQGRTMGTFFTIKYIPGEAVAGALPGPAEIEAGIDGVLDRVNGQMSTYLPNSEISRFNACRETGWFDVSGDLVRVFAEAVEVSRMSQGAFDITVGPLVNLWGFGPEKRPVKIPGAEEIEAVRGYTGYEKIALRLSPPAIKKEDPRVYCDLSGIAKGFGVDQVGLYLESLGIGDYMVEIGGEVRARGKNRQERWWRIGISTPESVPGIQKVVALKNLAMATSGDYRNYYEKQGVRYSHTIDPATGKPITHKLASVTVVYDNCTVADALATAIDVMGPDRGFELALKEKLAVFMIIRADEGFVEKKSPAFAALLKENDE